MQPADQYRSHLFTLRLWEEHVGRGESEIRFKVRHVLSGEVRYFREWSDVVAFVTSVVEGEVDDVLNIAD